MARGRRRRSRSSRPSRCRCAALLGEEIGEWFADAAPRRGRRAGARPDRRRRSTASGRLDAVTLDDGRRLRGRPRADRDRRAARARLARGVRAAGRAGSRPMRAGAARSPDVYAAGDAAAFLRPVPRPPRADRPLGVGGPPGRRGRERDRRPPARRAGAVELLERPVRDPHPVPRARAARRPGRDRRRSRRARLRRALHARGRAGRGPDRRAPEGARCEMRERLSHMTERSAA